jgi:hypothetical protein
MGSCHEWLFANDLYSEVQNLRKNVTKSQGFPED